MIKRLVNIEKRDIGYMLTVELTDGGGRRSYQLSPIITEINYRPDEDRPSVSIKSKEEGGVEKSDWFHFDSEILVEMFYQDICSQLPITKF